MSDGDSPGPAGPGQGASSGEEPPPGRASLLGPAEVRELAERLGVSPTKKLGQNFVIDPNTVRKIVRLAGVGEGDRVLEVGPGLGSLTLGLTEAGAEVTAVEIDLRLAAELPATLHAMQPAAADRLRVIRSDALDLTLEQLSDAAPAEAASSAASLPTLLVANLPYNVSVPILMHLLELIPGAPGSSGLSSGLVMVQAEVGHRIAARPGGKEYGAPSAKAAWYGEWRIAGTVSRRIFWPVPGVDSVLVAYERHAEPLGDDEARAAAFALVNAAFAQRRKMLRQALQPVLGGTNATVRVLEAAGIDPTSRAEQLGIGDYLDIALAARALA